MGRPVRECENLSLIHIFMRKGSICVTAPEQPKAVVSELVVAAGKADCELVCLLYTSNGSWTTGF